MRQDNIVWTTEVAILIVNLHSKLSQQTGPFYNSEVWRSPKNKNFLSRKYSFQTYCPHPESQRWWHEVLYENKICQRNCSSIFNFSEYVCVLLHHIVQFIMQVSLKINVFIWTSDKEVLIWLNHTLNTRNPRWNIKRSSELSIFSLGHKQLQCDTRLTQNNRKSHVRPHNKLKPFIFCWTALNYFCACGRSCVSSGGEVSQLRVSEGVWILEENFRQIDQFCAPSLCNVW